MSIDISYLILKIPYSLLQFIISQNNVKFLFKIFVSTIIIIHHQYINIPLVCVHPFPLLPFALLPKLVFLLLNCSGPCLVFFPLELLHCPPPCLDQPPKPTSLKTVGSSHLLSLSPQFFSTCQLKALLTRSPIVDLQETFNYCKTFYPYKHKGLIIQDDTFSRVSILSPSYVTMEYGSDFTTIGALNMLGDMDHKVSLPIPTPKPTSLKTVGSSRLLSPTFPHLVGSVQV
jgi:hypothetical protein